MTSTAMKIDSYRSILAVIEKVYRLLPDEPKRPLTFPAIVGRSYDENFISDYLAYILDPTRNGIGNAPLKALLNLVTNAYDDADFESVDIRREYTFASGGRIDFLILVDDSLVIGIENKIFSSEGKRQTIGYEKSIKQKFEGFDSLFIYLAPGEQSPSSKVFRYISYSQFYESLRQIQYSWTQDVRRSFFWEDFLTHLEVYISMSKGLPEVSEKTKLYLENAKMLRDIQKHFENDNAKLYDFLITKVSANFDSRDWEYKKELHAHFFSKHSWHTDKKHWFLLRFRFRKEVLLANKLSCSLEVQGKEKDWNTSPGIDTLIDLFVTLHPDIARTIKSKGMTFHPENRRWAIAYKDYDLQPTPEFIDNQLSKAIDDFSFLIALVDATVAEYNGTSET